MEGTRGYTKGIFQSKMVTGTRTFSTLQVSFGQLNFVSKKTEKAKTINQRLVKRQINQNNITENKQTKAIGVTNTAYRHG